MCGRFTLHVSPNKLAELFQLATSPTLAPRYNIAPTQPIGIVRIDPERSAREWTLVVWGLVPSWSKDPSIGSRMINARSETAHEKPSFRAAFRRRRCLIPADGFYEWKRSGNKKQPYFIQLADGAPFAFAGLWEQWMAPDGSELQTSTILTCDANERVAPIHPRMPVILQEEDYGEWLGEETLGDAVDLTPLRHLLRPYASEKMSAFPVSTYVNRPQNEGADCIRPLDTAD